MTNRYMTPLEYKDGNGNKVRTKLYFELDPVELADWTFENPFDANELVASMVELKEIEKEESRNLTQDEIRTMLGVIKLLARISAGRPTEDGLYFLKDPNWTSSYAYREFRTFLMTHPKETETFLTTLLDNEVMAEFTKALAESADKIEAEGTTAPQTSDSGPDTIEKMEAKLAEMRAAKNQLTSVPPVTE